MDIEIVAEGLEFPEGPIACADGSVLVVEIARQTLTRVKPDGGIEIVAQLGAGPMARRSARTARSMSSTMAARSAFPELEGGRQARPAGALRGRRSSSGSTLRPAR